MGAQKSVTIEFDDSGLEKAKGSHYRLCFAKKVGDHDYNVVWQSYDKYIHSNDFTWTPKYQIFGTNSFGGPQPVKATTKKPEINLNETITLDEAGEFGAPATSDPATSSITLVNDYGDIHPGVNQLSKGIDGKEHTTPIYVAVDPILKGKDVLTPKDTVLVWLEQDIETSTMFSTARTTSVEIDLTSTDSATRRYVGKTEEWITPAPSA